MHFYKVQNQTTKQNENLFCFGLYLFALHNYCKICKIIKTKYAGASGNFYSLNLS